MARTVEPLWSALRKNWKKYKILNNKKYVHSKTKKLRVIAKRIRKIQEKLGVPKSQFTEIGVAD